MTLFVESFESAPSGNGWTETGTVVASTDEAFDGDMSLKIEPDGGDNHITRTDVEGAGDAAREFWVAYAVMIPDWTVFWDSGAANGGKLVGIDPDGSFGFPSHDAQYFFATSDTTGVIGFEGQFGGFAEVALTEGVWHKIRARYLTASTPSATDGEVEGFVDGVSAGTLTGCRTFSSGLFAGSYSDAGNGGAYYIDKLTYQPDTDPGDVDPATAFPRAGLPAPTDVIVEGVAQPVQSDLTVNGGNYLSGAADGRTMLELENTGGGAETVEVPAGILFDDGVTVEPLVINLGAGDTVLAGPFRASTFKQDINNTLYLDTSDNAVKLRAYRLPVPA